MKYKAAIDRFKLYDPNIPSGCIEDLNRAMRLHNPERVEESIPIFERAIERYSRYLNPTSLAEIYIALGFSYLVTDRLDESRAALVSVMEMPGLDDFYYGFAQTLVAQVEMDRGNYDRALAIIDSAEKDYALDPKAYDYAREIISEAKRRDISGE